MDEHMKRRLFVLCIAIIMILADVPCAHACAQEYDVAEQDFYIETTISESYDMSKDSESKLKDTRPVKLPGPFQLRLHLPMMEILRSVLAAHMKQSHSKKSGKSNQCHQKRVEMQLWQLQL